MLGALAAETVIDVAEPANVAASVTAVVELAKELKY